MPKPIKFSNLLASLVLLPSVSPKPSKEKLNKLKFHSKNKSINTPNHSERKEGCLYVQASSGNVKEILKLKENFPQLLLKKIEDIYKTINRMRKPKLHINMTTEGLS